MKTVVVNINVCPKCHVYVGRTNRGAIGFGNPFRVSEFGHGKCIRMFRHWLRTGESQGCSSATQDRRLWILRRVHTLRGKTLGCFCKPKPCHGDVLAWLAERPGVVKAWFRRSTGRRYRVLACGGRDYHDRRAVFRMLDGLHAKKPITLLIAGCARGADSLALEWARERRVPRRRFVADWKGQGRAAGFLRNAAMLREGRPNLVVAFPGGAGTRDMTHRARFAGVPIVEKFL